MSAPDWRTEERLPAAPARDEVREAAELRSALEREADCKCRDLYCRHTSAAIDAAWTLLSALAAKGGA